MRSFLIAGLYVVLLFVDPGKLAAHPLGNFSISQYSAIRIHREEIQLRYIVDMAEIPTFQEIQENGITATPGDSGVEIYLERKAESLRDGLKLEVNGQRLAPSVEAREVIFPPGAGGLPTLKISILFRAKLAVDSGTGESFLSYRDNNFAGRAGWKEIIAVSEPGARILHSSAPETDRSSQLNDYPTDLSNSPPQELEANVAFATGVPAAPVSLADDSAPRVNVKTATTVSESRMKGAEVSQRSGLGEAGKPTIAPVIQSVEAAPDLPRAKDNEPVQLHANLQATPRNAFTELMAEKQLGFGIALLAVAVALGLGAFHALEPGHGKTLVAAYLVGSRGTMKHAFLLGLIVTAAHTFGVYLLGAVTLYASQYVLPERLYPWLAVVSGILIAGLGGVLLVRRYLGKDKISGHHHHHHGNHNHDTDDHHHDHHHSHDDGHRHIDRANDEKVSLRELLTLGISGGIVPCPAALVVLLSAVSMQRIGFGLLLIVAFSVGLAAVLITIGLFMVYARHFMSRFQAHHRLTTRWLPMTSSAFIFLFGIALTLQALRTAGIWPAHL